jgi:hypothetical protein
VKTVEINTGTQKTDVYDTVSRTFLGRGVSGDFRFPISADAARVLVLIPEGTRISVENGTLIAGKVPLDYRYQR